MSQSICPLFGEEFTYVLRDYLKKHGMVNAEGQPSLGKMSSKMLQEEVQRFFDWKMEKLAVRKEKAAKDRKARSTFVPPTPEEVEAYSREIGWPMNGQDWCDAYAKKDWKVGKVGMRDWRAAVRTWKAQKILPSAVGTPQATKAPESFIPGEPDGWQAWVDDYYMAGCVYSTGGSRQSAWGKLPADFRAEVLAKMPKGKGPQSA